TWSAAPAARRSSAGVCVAVLAAIVMFAFGFILGGLLHAVAFPGTGSPLALGNFSFNDNTDVAILNNQTEVDDNSSESSKEDGEVELTTDAVYSADDDNSEDDTDCREFPWKNFRYSSGCLKDLSPFADIARLTTALGNFSFNDNTDVAILNNQTEVDDNSSESSKEEGEVELTTDAVYSADEDNADDDTDCREFPWKNFRLPRDVVPTSYNLTIHPNITTNNMTGSLAIDIQVLNSTKLIVLHADNLILTTFIMSVNSKRMEAEFFFCPETSQWAFVMDDEVHAGDAIDLGIEFQGEVLPDLQGLYISTHTDARGRKSLYIDVFHRTVKMSTYLLAVAILDNYDYVKRTTKKTQAPIEVRLYAPKDVIRGQTEFGLDTAIRSLEFFENYFNISYPLDKIDLLALDDFSEGAMENWGLITFRDSTLLHAQGIASALAKEQIALVICHEIAHQWFGNLVTMNWWNDLWLNEGFANYMEYRCVDKLFPDWNIMTRFYVENVAFSHEPDGLRSSRAVSTHTSNETNIMGLFDAISYHKAAAIIRMLQSLSGERNFQRSLIQYLNKYAYGNAKGAQLWKIVEKHAVLPHGVSIASLATAYITQVGCPMIYVTLSKNEVIVHNQVYVIDLWGTPPILKVSWPLAEHAKWVIANTGGFSYVKVLYDKKNYAALAKQLRTNHTAISTIDRSMILVDAFDFSKTSKLDIGVYLDLLLYAEGLQLTFSTSFS
ncbi:peptidase family M1, partial [Teladorsagia circumcincta]